MYFFDYIAMHFSTLLKDWVPAIAKSNAKAPV